MAGNRFNVKKKTIWIALSPSIAFFCVYCCNPIGVIDLLQFL